MILWPGTSLTSLYYYRARYYDSAVGRFGTEDSSKYASLDLSLYAYVGDSPTNFRDPTGLVRVDPGFPKSCLSNLNRALLILRRAAKNPKCNCLFLKTGGPPLTPLLDTPNITIHYDPAQNNTADPEESGEAVRYTNPGDTSNIWLYPFACHMGRWTIASNLVHELMHIALIPALGQEDVANQAMINCGFRMPVLGVSITVRGY